MHIPPASESEEPRRIGENVRRARRARGQTIQVLAGLAGRSMGWLSEVERGLRVLDRRSDIAALAAALNVSPTDLLTVGAPPTLAEEADGVMLLRTMLHDTAIDDPPDVAARPLPVLAEITRGAIARYRRQADYPAVTREASSVLAELHVHANTGAERDRIIALRQIVDLAGAAAFCVRHLGAIDLAWIAADRARQAAAALGDQVSIGAAWFARAHAQPTAATARPLRLAATAAERIAPNLDPGDVYGQQVYGMLHLTAALAAQTQGNDPGSCAHLDEAARVAGMLGERSHAWQSFGPSNVLVWRVMIEVEAGRPERALPIVPNIDLRPLGRGRRAALLIEQARAHAMLGRSHSEQAAQHLRHAERLAASRVHHNPLARELVADLLDHAHRVAVSQTLRGLAHRMAITV